jgi:membrane protease YdiL (CAAX protease family)
MPALVPAEYVELVLVITGLVIVWLLALSPAARARPKTPVLAAWDARLSDFFLFLWLIVCGGLIGQFAASLLFQPLALSEDGKLVFVNCAFHLGMLTGIGVFRVGFARLRAPAGVAPSASVPLSGAVTFLVAMPVVVAVGLGWQALLKARGLPVEQQDIVGRLVAAKSPALLVCMILLATVVAPVTEELIFRAGFFRFLRTRLPRWAALLLPACFFAALHQNLASFAPLVALGIVFSLAYERTGRIGTSMVAHGLFNAHTIALIFLSPDADPF